MSSTAVRHVDDVVDDVTALARCAGRRECDSATTLALVHPATSESHCRNDVTVRRSMPEVVSTSTTMPALMTSENCRIVLLSRRRPVASPTSISPTSTRSTTNSCKCYQASTDKLHGRTSGTRHIDPHPAPHCGVLPTGEFNAITSGGSRIFQRRGQVPKARGSRRRRVASCGGYVSFLAALLYIQCVSKIPKFDWIYF